MKGDIPKTIRLIEEAKTLAQDNGVLHMEKILDTEEQHIQAEMDKWVQFSEADTPIKDRFTESRVMEYLKEAKKVARLS